MNLLCDCDKYCAGITDALESCAIAQKQIIKETDALFGALESINKNMKLMGKDIYALNERLEALETK